MTGTFDITSRPVPQPRVSPEGPVTGSDVPSGTSLSAFRRVMPPALCDVAPWRRGPELRVGQLVANSHAKATRGQTPGHWARTVRLQVINGPWQRFTQNRGAHTRAWPPADSKFTGALTPPPRKQRLRNRKQFQLFSSTTDTLCPSAAQRRNSGERNK